MIYTGIGARKTPGNILHSMVQVGEYMAYNGHTLRSGGAQGADRAFEIGCDYKSIGTKEIFLAYEVSSEAMTLASKFHPAWKNLSPYVKKLMGRNSFQILGRDLDTPTGFVICWTPDGKIVGGTGQALRMANYYEIPIINFGSASFVEIDKRLMDILGET